MPEFTDTDRIDALNKWAHQADATMWNNILFYAARGDLRKVVDVYLYDAKKEEQPEHIVNL